MEARRSVLVHPLLLVEELAGCSNTNKSPDAVNELCLAPHCFSIKDSP
jgi:hypothetical protein